MMTKVTMLYNQSKNMATMACCFAPPSPKMFYR
jgi:hypothetical protein